MNREGTRPGDVRVFAYDTPGWNAFLPATEAMVAKTRPAVDAPDELLRLGGGGYGKGSGLSNEPSGLVQYGRLERGNDRR